MARSQYVYLVTSKNRPALNACAAFTVKHEMLRWLSKVRDENPDVQFLVRRLPDGGSGPPVEMDV